MTRFTIQMFARALRIAVVHGCYDDGHITESEARAILRGKELLAWEGLVFISTNPDREIKNPAIPIETVLAWGHAILAESINKLKLCPICESAPLLFFKKTTEQGYCSQCQTFLFLDKEQSSTNLPESKIDDFLSAVPLVMAY